VTSAKVRTALIVASLVAAVAFSTWSSGRWEPESVGPTRRPAKVLIFGVSRLGWDDIGTGVMPNLDALIGRGALAAMSVRTLSSNPSVAEGYATLGAGSRVKAPASAGVAFDGPGGTLTVAGARAAAQANDDLSVPSLPGALGDALRGAGRSTAVINNADSSPAGGPAALSRPAGLALMDRSGRIDSGAVDADALLTDGPTASGMRVADPDKFLARTQEAMSRADVVLVDPGEIDRAAVSLGPEARRAALNGTDAVLGRVMATVSPDALVLVVGVTPAGRVWHLTPVVATGAGVVGGYLHSPSTKRLGLITLTDIAPTVLHSLGALVPPRMVGHSLRYHPGRPDLGRLTRLDRDATYREGIYFPITLAFIVFNAVVYISAIAVLARRRGAGGWAPPLRAIALAIAAFPLATFLFRAVPGEGGLGDAGWAVLLAIDVAIVALARRARRRPLSPLAWILGSTTWLLIGDIATGARLQVASIMGYSPHTAARFFGIGNTAFAALAASAILGAAIHLDAAPRRREALVGVAAFFALVAFIDGAPALGDDVGGILTLVPIFGLTLVALSGKRLSWRKLVAAVGLGIVVVAVAAGVDLLRAPEARTHLGRLVADVSHNGPGTMFTTVARKTKTNLRVLRGSVWTWTVPIVAGFMLYVLVWQRRWTELLPPASARRTGVIAALAAGLLGFALNDSGVIVTAVVLVYVGPFLTLLALEGEDRGTVAVESSPLPAPMAIS